MRNIILKCDNSSSLIYNIDFKFVYPKFMKKQAIPHRSLTISASFRERFFSDSPGSAVVELSCTTSSWISEMVLVILSFICLSPSMLPLISCSYSSKLSVVTSIVSVEAPGSIPGSAMPLSIDSTTIGSFAAISTSENVTNKSLFCDPRWSWTFNRDGLTKIDWIDCHSSLIHRGIAKCAAACLFMWNLFTGASKTCMLNYVATLTNIFDG